MAVVVGATVVDVVDEVVVVGATAVVGVVGGTVGDAAERERVAPPEQPANDPATTAAAMRFLGSTNAS
jgi:hypothetical protein